MQHEKLEQQRICTLLKSIGAAVYVLGTRRKRGDYQGTMMSSGLPDLLCFLPGSPIVTAPQALWIEVKAARGVRSPAQHLFAEYCASASVPYLCGGLDEVITFLVSKAYVKSSQLAHYRQPRVM